MARATYRPEQQGHRRNLRFVIPLLLVVASVTGVVLFVDFDDDVQELDADLCPIAPNSSAHRAVLLLDLRKPVPIHQATGRSLAGEAWQLASADVAASTQLDVFTVGTDPMAALRPLAQLCKPYDNVALAIGRPEDDELDCRDPAADLTAHQRTVAGQFCARRAELRTRIEDFAAQSSAPVDNAYLVEAIEEISLALATETRPKSLFVFSDMLQHASWYSHIALAPDTWDFRSYVSTREEQTARIGSRPPALRDLPVTLYYVPRQGMTDMPPAAQAHQQFWQAFFAASTGAEPRFSAFPPAPSYETTPLTGQIGEAAAVTQARLRLQRTLEAAERELSRLTQERAALAEDRSPAQQQPPPAEDAEPLTAQAQAPAEPSEPVEELTAADAPDEQAPFEDVGEQQAAADDEAASEPPPPQLQQPVATPPAPAEPAEVFLADETPPSTTPAEPAATCRAELLPEYTLAAPAYPGRQRVDYGSATITLSYTIDEEGNTADDSMDVLMDASSATRPVYFDLFADEARTLAARYRYRFDESSNGACARRQRRTTQFVFEYDR